MEQVLRWTNQPTDGHEGSQGSYASNKLVEPFLSEGGSGQALRLWVRTDDFSRRQVYRLRCHQVGRADGLRCHQVGRAGELHCHQVDQVYGLRCHQVDQVYGISGYQVGQVHRLRGQVQWTTSPAGRSGTIRLPGMTNSIQNTLQPESFSTWRLGSSSKQTTYIQKYADYAGTG